jgi:hypothetical protein
VELFTHFEGCRNPYIIRKKGVHRSSQRGRSPLLWYSNPGRLPARMDTSVRSACTDDGDGDAA